MSTIKTASVLAAAVIAAASTAAIASNGPAAKPAMEKCYGVAKAGKNDCKAGVCLLYTSPSPRDS